MALQMSKCSKVTTARQCRRATNFARHSISSPVTFVTDVPTPTIAEMKIESLREIKALVYENNAKLAKYILESAQQAGARQVVRERTELAGHILRAAILKQ